MMRRLGLLGTMTLSCTLFACGSDNNADAPVSKPDAPISNPDAPGGTADARPADARPADAGGPDAGPTFSGTVAIHDVQLIGANGMPVAAAGHGGQISASFSKDITNPTMFAKRTPPEMFAGSEVP